MVLGDSPVLNHGHIWEPKQNWGSEEFRTELGPVGTTGKFTSKITTLYREREYLVKAYATTEHGTFYGPEISFTTSHLDMTPYDFIPFSTKTNKASESQSMRLGAYLTHDLTITAPDGFEVSANSATGYANKLVISYKFVSGVYVWVRLKSQNAGDFTGDITFITGEDTIKKSVKGSAYPPPTITSFKPTTCYKDTRMIIYGSNFIPSDKVSVTLGGLEPWAYSYIWPEAINLGQCGGATGDISVTTPGGTATMAGLTVLPDPVIEVSGTMNQFSSTWGLPSDYQTITVSGYNLTDDIHIDCADSYQVSLTPGFERLVTTLPRINGKVDATTLYFRLSPGASWNYIYPQFSGAGNVLRDGSMIITEDIFSRQVMEVIWTTAILHDAVTSVSVPANNLYEAFQNLDFTVEYTSEINVTGMPCIPLTLGTGGVVNASYFSGSGTKSLTFRYTIAKGNADSNGISLGSSIVLNDGSMKNIRDVDATLTLNNVASTSHVLVGALAPTVLISSTSPEATSVSPIPVTFTFSEPVYGFVAEDITVDNGTLADFTGNGTIFTANINPLGPGSVNVNIADSVAMDFAGNSNTAATQFSRSYLKTPTATTNAASSIMSVRATLNGSINANNGNTTVTFEYGTTTAYGSIVTANPNLVKGLIQTSVSKEITDLIPNTTYYYRVKGVNTVGTSNGSKKSFTTSLKPVLAISGSLSTFASCQFTASETQSFTVSGRNLVDGITVTVPTGFEIKTASGSEYSYNVRLTPSDGTVPATDFTIRISGTAVGDHSGNITASSLSASPMTLAVNGKTIFSYPPTGLVTVDPPSGKVCKGGLVTLTAVKNTDLTFDGADDYVNIGDMNQLDGTAQFTIEAMLYAGSIAQNRTIFSKRADESNKIQLYFSAGSGLSLSIGNGAASLVDATTTVAFPINTWTHVAAVYNAAGGANADKIKIYLDGVQADLSFTGTMPATTNSNAAPVLLGAETTTPGTTAFKGKMNDFRIWNTARSAADVLASVNQCLSGSTVGLVAEFKFDLSETGGITKAYSDCSDYIGTLVNFDLSAAWNASTVGCTDNATFTWSGNVKNGIPFIPDDSHNYVVTCTEPNVCRQTPDQFVAIRVDAAPTPVIYGNGSVNKNTPYEYTTQSGLTGYTWAVSAGGTITGGNGTNAVYVTWNTSGAQWISVNYANAEGCTAAIPSKVDVTVSPTETLGVTGTLAPFTTCEGAASSYQSFSVVGNRLTDKILISAPSGFEVSTATGSGFSTSLELFPVEGSVYSTPIYARMAASASGNPSGNISVTSTGAYPVLVAISGSKKSPVTPTFSVDVDPPSGTVCAGATVKLTASSNTANDLTFSWSGGITNGTPFVPAITGTYKVTATDLASCNATASQSVMITLEQVPTLTGPATICQNSPGNVYSTEAGMTGYTWNVSEGGTITAGGGATDNTVTVTWTTAGDGTVSVNYTNGNSCRPVNATVYPVTVNEMLSASVTIAANAAAVCAGASIIFTATPADGVPAPAYQWYNGTTPVGSNSTTYSYTPVNGDVITVVMTPAASNCFSGDPVTSNAETVIVNPIPDINQPADQAVCAEGTVAAVDFSGSVAGTSFNWVNNTPSIGLAASGTGNIPSFTAVNATNAPIKATVTVTPLRNESFAYIANDRSHTVSVINTASNAVIATIPVEYGPMGVSVVPDGTKVFVCNSASGSVSVINTTTNTVSATIFVGSWPNNVSVSPDGKRAYVSNVISSTVSVINTATNSVIATIPADAPGGISISPDNSRAYISNGGGNTVSVVNTATNTIIGTIPVESGPGLSVITPDGSKVYVSTNGSVSVIGTATNTVIATISRSSNTSYGIAVTPDGSKVYVSNYASNNVSVINTITNTISSTISGGLVEPAGISFVPDGSICYIANSGSASVSVVNTATNTITGSVAVGASPYSNGNFIRPGITCPGEARSFNIAVKPEPDAIVTPGSQSICTPATITTMALSGKVEGTVFNWTRDNTESVTGIAESGTGNISGALTNTTLAPVTVTFTITPIAGNCTGKPVNATVTVNPAPVPTITGNATVSVGSTGNVYSTETGMTNYIWTVSSGGTITAGGTAGSNSVTVTWNTKGPQEVRVKYTNSSSCTAALPTVYNVTVLSGEIHVVPGTLSPFTSCTGSVSSSQSFTVSGTSIDANIMISAPSDFEVSTESESNFSNSLTLVPVSGALPATLVYVRTAASASGNPSGSISVTCTDAFSKYVEVSGTTTDRISPSFSVEVDPPSGHVCAGIPVTLTASAAAGNDLTFSWSGGITNGKSFIPTESFNYFVTATGPSPCNAWISQSVMITVDPKPTITGPETVCQNSEGNVYTTEAGMTGYTWNVSEGGTITAGTVTNSITVTWNTPENQTVGVNYTNLNGCSAASPTSYAVKVNPALPVSVSINPDATTVCQNTSVIFTPVPINGGYAPTYQWYKGETKVGTGYQLYYAPANGDQISVVMTAGKGICLSGSPATSDKVTMTVNPMLTPSVAIEADNNPVCIGSGVTIVATPENGGETPSYQWFKEGVRVGTNSPELTYIPKDGEWIRVVMTSSGASCLTSNEATSDIITMRVKPLLTSGVNIAADANQVCIGTSVSFTATPATGITAASYQWYIGSTQVGTNSPVYAYIPADGDKISVMMTPDGLTCPSNAPVISNEITMSVYSWQAASVAIVADKNPVCKGGSVRFTATPENAGQTPSYQWFKGTDMVGGNSPVYTYVPADGDVITVSITFDNTSCLTGSPALSNPVTMTVNPGAPVSVTIAPDANQVCEGTEVAFTATPVNGGTAPSYQWYRNKAPVGVDIPTFSYYPTNGDVISVVMTSNESSCLAGSPANSNEVTMTVKPWIFAAVTIVADNNPVCKDVSVTFTAFPTNGGGTPFYQWYNGLNKVGDNSPTYSYIPKNGDKIKVVMTSNAEFCLVNSEATSNIITMTVNSPLQAKVMIASDANVVCAGTSVSFIATPLNGGPSPSYHWFNGATEVGTDSPVYAYIPADGDKIKVVMTSNATPCLSGSPATSNEVTMTVNPILTASVAIVADKNPICKYASVLFTATPTNGGSIPNYQWYNGTKPVGENSPTYTYVPTDGDVITVVMNSTVSSCLSGSPAVSNPVTMTVIPYLSVFVTVAPDANQVCDGTTVKFTASPTNGGTAPTYQWYLGETPVGTDASTYSYKPANGDVISVAMTSNASSCLDGSPARSYPVTMTVHPVLDVSVTIAPDKNSVCEGTYVTLTATPTNGGSPPSYQWYNGATKVGNGSLQYTYQPANGDKIRVIMASTEGSCFSGSPATSNEVTMIVNPSLTPLVAIDADNNPVCVGTGVTFTATPTNGGDTPSYQWYNGINKVGNDSPTYSYTPVDGDRIKVEMTSSGASCLLFNVATSDVITMEVKPLLTSGVTIAPDANPACIGSLVTFTATPANGGTTPSYQWYNGATKVGTDSPAYAYIPADGDKIKVVMTPDATTCASGSPVTSNEVTMEVNSAQTASVAIVADKNPVCEGGAVQFTATPANGGETPTYQWYNGINTVGTDSPTYTYVPANGDVITVSMTSAVTSCLTGYPALSNPVTMTVNPTVTASVTVTPDANPVCENTLVQFTATPVNGGTAPTYQWYLNEAPIGTNIPEISFYPANGDVISVVMTSNESSCLAGSPATSNLVTMTVNQKLNAAVAIVADANPVCEGTTVLFTATPTNGGTTPTYQWYLGESMVGTGGQTYAYTPANGDVISVVITSNATACLGYSISHSDPITITVNSSLTVGVSIVADANPVYTGTSVTFTATPTNGGETPSYQWYNKAAPVGTNSPEYKYIPAEGDKIKVVMTSNAESCLLNSPATSNEITMTVNSNLTASVSIVADANPVCSGTSVTFTATPVNGGTAPTYQWYQNGTPVGENIPAFSCVPVNGDVISVVMTPGLSGTPATSNLVTMTVNTSLTASVAIAADANPVCSGTNVIFTATPTNGGEHPSYQWYNGTNMVGTDSPTFTYIPSNNDKITVVMTSGESACLSGSPATSNAITMTVNPSVTASVRIVASKNPVCAGTNVTFTATPTNGGTPVYQWYKGDTQVGTNLRTYLYAPANGDVISVVMTSNASSCLVNSSVTSNAVTMLLTPALTASTFSVTADPPSGNVCAGNAVKLTAASNDLTFDGENDYVNLGDMNELDGTTTFTIETMFYSTESGDTKTLFSKRVDNNNKIQLFSNLLFAVGNNNDLMEAYPSGLLMLTNTWIHVAAVYNASGATDADKMKIYINGVAQSLVFNGTTPPTTAVNSAPALIGSESINANYDICYTGRVNDFRIWNTARSATQVLISANQSLSGSTTGLIAEYRLNELPGSTTAANSAGSGYNGTLVNFDATTAWKPNNSSSGTVTSYAWTGGISNDASFVPSQSGTYTVTATGTACSSAKALQSVLITVNPRPTITITGPATVCQNASGNVYTTEADMTGYTWNVSAGGTITAGSDTHSITVTWNTAGPQSVDVNYTNSQNCSAATPASYAVTVNAITSAPVITSPIATGATSVSGTSSEIDGTTIDVLINAVSKGTTTVTTNAWTKTDLTALTDGQVVTANATATGKCVSPISNSVTVISPVIATQLSINAATDHQTATVGTALPTPVSVTVKDGLNKPVSGVSVTFAVVTGGGSVTYASQLTNSRGIAAIGSWILGQIAGKDNNTLIVTSGSLTPVTFFASGTAGDVATVTPSGAESIASDIESAEYTAISYDVYGNEVSDDTHIWSVTNGTGSANLSNSNKLMGVLAGKVTMKATSVQNSAVGGNLPVTVTAGAATHVTVETKTDGTGSPLIATHMPIGSTLTVYAVARDVNNNFVANVTADGWSLPDKSGVVDGDLAGSGASAVFTGHAVGTATIQATSAGLTPVKSGTVTVTSLPALSLKVFLEGPFNKVAGSMDITLNTAHYIPLAQPYSAEPWKYKGTESVGSIPDGVVDWVLVELRQAATPEAAIPSTILSGWPKACFLKSDGSIMNYDGSGLTVNTAFTGNLFVVIRHRNHVAIMSSTGMILSDDGNSYSYDFTSAVTQAYGGEAGYKLIPATAKCAMVGGDADGDGNVWASDFNKWAALFYQQHEYFDSDFNLDGDVFVTDYDIWAANFMLGNAPALKSVNINATGIHPSIKYKSQVPVNR